MKPVATSWAIGAAMLLNLGLPSLGRAGEPAAEGEAEEQPETGTPRGEGGGPTQGEGAAGAEPKGPTESPPAGTAPDGADGGGSDEAGSTGPDGAGADARHGAKGAGGGARGSGSERPGGDTRASAGRGRDAAAGEAGAEVPEEADEEHQGSFAFGSYGRIIAATDGLGRPGRDVDIVAHGSRFDLSNYVELELRREDHWAAVEGDTRIVATLALGHPIFHWSGEFDGAIAIRNMFVEETDLGAKGLSIWAGSRMLRGDDIYLLDFWPLDNLNTIGGGLRYGICGEPEPAPTPTQGDAASASGTDGADGAEEEAAVAATQVADVPPPWCTGVAAHFGLARPNNPFYMQEVSRPVSLNQFGVATVDILNRQRFVGNLRGEQIVRFGGSAGLKLVAYGEVHGVPSSQQQAAEQPEVYEDLPGDTGWVLGGQVGLFTGEDATHVNLFVRYASGLPAYGEFATPTSLALDRTATDAHEILVALGGNWEFDPIALTLGSYFRSFRNANGLLDFEDLDEGIVLLRPHLFFIDWAGVALEGSYQVQQRGVVTTGLENPTEGQDFEPLLATVGRIGVMPFVSPAGPGAFSRPWIFLSYMASFRNDGARELYPETDPFRIHSIEHQVAIGAEWWFSSSSYGGQ